MTPNKHKRFVPYSERFGVDPLPVEPTYTLDRQIAAARQSMGEETWQRLNAEWEQR